MGDYWQVHIARTNRRLACRRRRSRRARLIILGPWVGTSRRGDHPLDVWAASAGFEDADDRTEAQRTDYQAIVQSCWQRAVPLRGGNRRGGVDSGQAVSVSTPPMQRALPPPRGATVAASRRLSDSWRSPRRMLKQAERAAGAHPFDLAVQNDQPQACAVCARLGVRGNSQVTGGCLRRAEVAAATRARSHLDAGGHGQGGTRSGGRRGGHALEQAAFAEIRP